MKPFINGVINFCAKLSFTPLLFNCGLELNNESIRFTEIFKTGYQDHVLDKETPVK